MKIEIGKIYFTLPEPNPIGMWGGELIQVVPTNRDTGWVKYTYLTKTLSVDSFNKTEFVFKEGVLPVPEQFILSMED